MTAGIHDIAVVILAYGSSREFQSAQGDVLAAGVPPRSVIVVHNPNRPDQEIPPTEPGTQVIRMERNVGYAAAMNAGIDRARAQGFRFVLLLTHDARLRDGALSSLRTSMDAHPTHAVLAPVLFQSSARAEPSYGSRQDDSGRVCHVTQIDQTNGDVVDMPWVDGSVMLLRESALPTVAPLPGRYFMYFEEAHLCSLVRTRGWRVATVLAAAAESVPGGGQRSAAYAYLYARNGVHWSRAFCSRRQRAQFVRSQIHAAWLELPKPGGQRFTDPVARKRGVAMATGRSLGVLAACARQGGPPPRWLRSGSDIAFVG